MILNRLDIQNLRNLKAVTVYPSQQFNLLYGHNGSGKTSFLEAIYYLALGRSFRTRHPTCLIHYEASVFSLFATIHNQNQTVSVGIARKMNGENRIRINKMHATSLLEVTRLLPIRFICSESRSLLISSSKIRRQFIDWGVFHMEPAFLKPWQHIQRALKQRNAALKTSPKRTMVKAWENILEVHAQQINVLRQRYVVAFKILLTQVLSDLLPDKKIYITYKAGWDETRSLTTIWDQTWLRDLMLGYTQHGPHRADLLFRLENNQCVQEGLSQGQQKLLVYALYLTQGLLLQKNNHKKCIYLLDDLPAELDAINRQRVITALKAINAQVFITGVDNEILSQLQTAGVTQSFAVNHGQILTCNYS